MSANQRRARKFPLHRLMRLPGGSAGFRLYETVFRASEADVVLTFCDAWSERRQRLSPSVLDPARAFLSFAPDLSTCAFSARGHVQGLLERVGNPGIDNRARRQTTLARSLQILWSLNP
jgi:hypothetical protein